MATVKRRDVNALLLLIALELGLLCLLAVTFRHGSAGELTTSGAAPVGPLAFERLGPEPTPPEVVVAAPPVEPPKPSEPVRKPTVRIPAAPAVEDVAPAEPDASPAPTPAVVMASLAPSVESKHDPADRCGGDLCCVAAASAKTGAAANAAHLRDAAESDNPDRVVITWPASKRDDVVYRVFTLPNRRFVGSSAENAFAHVRKADDPDCYKIQACDRAGVAAGGPLTICITRRRLWGA